MEREERVSLATLARGAAIERFDDEFSRVLNNILDPNTVSTQAREITLKVKVKPNDDRSAAAVHVYCSCKTAPPKVEQTLIYIGRTAEGAVALEHNPEQMKLNLPKPEKPRVVEAPGRKE